jgi:hypothetical protein
MFCYRLEYFIVLWCILWQVGKISGRLVYYYLFWYVLPRKSGNPGITFAATATSTNVRVRFYDCVSVNKKLVKGVAKWSSHPPLELTTRVRILPGCKTYRKNIAMLLCMYN